MANRKHPVLVATRVTVGERAIIEAAAEMEGQSVSTLLRRIVLPAVGERVAREAATLRQAGGEAPPAAA